MEDRREALQNVEIGTPHEQRATLATTLGVQGDTAFALEESGGPRDRAVSQDREGLGDRVGGEREVGGEAERGGHRVTFLVESRPHVNRGGQLMPQTELCMYCHQEIDELDSTAKFVVIRNATKEGAPRAIAHVGCAQKERSKLGSGEA